MSVPLSYDPVEYDFAVSLNALAERAHANSRAKGFWSCIDDLKTHPRFTEIEVMWKLSRIALIHSEASEALEGIRKDLKDDHLPERSMEVAEMADIVVRILDYCGAYNLPLGQVIVEKMRYNSGRPAMHGKKA